MKPEAIMRCVRTWPAFAMCGILTIAGIATAHAVVAVPPATPFVAAGGGVFDGPGAEVVPEVFDWSGSGPVLVETGALPQAYGRYRSAFGSNGFGAQVTGGIDRQVAGGSIWSDAFTITGGSGSGALMLSARIQGSVTGHVDMGYALLVSAQPFDLTAILGAVAAADDFWSVQLPGVTRVMYTGLANGCGVSVSTGDCAHVPYVNHQGPFDVTLVDSLPFTYGQTIYVASLLAGGVGVNGGSADFLNSANFGISAPAGASVAALSGTNYVAAVPEPAAVWMFLLGALVVATVVRRGARGATVGVPISESLS